MKKYAIAFILFVISSIGSATVFEVNLGTDTLENVRIAESARVRVNDRPARQLAFLGAGLRTKQVIVNNVKVYVAQLFGSSPTRFERTDDRALISLTSMQDIAMRLTFLRDLDAELLSGLLRESMVANGVSMDRTDIRDFLDAVRGGGPVMTGGSITIVGHVSNSDEVIIYESAAGRIQIIRGGRGFIRDIFSIWLGRPSDPGADALKKQILKAGPA